MTPASVPEMLSGQASIIRPQQVTVRLPGRRIAACLRAPARAQSGVGLIEVMVAVLLLSIAFLGIAALQAMSMSTNNSAMARSMATIASYSILDGMRADKASALAGSYNTSSPIAGSTCSSIDTSTLVGSQTAQWCTQLSSYLGKSASTTGNISCLATGDCTITITFDDSRAGVGGTSTQTVITRAML